MREKSLFFSLFLLFLIASPAAAAEDLTLDAFLQEALNNSEDLKAVDLDIRSLRLEIEARDIELSPTLAVQLLRFWDNRPSFASNPQTSGRSVEVDLTQPLATGTSLNLLTGLETSQYRSTGGTDRHLINWQLGITQSLWQNSFGRQTSLRRKRDDHELQSRLLTLLLERQRLIVEYEQLYWDIVYSQQAVKIFTENLERGRQILTWMEDRVKRSAAEEVDFLQAKALVATRELQLLVASDALQTLQARLKGKLALKTNIPFSVADLQKDRDLLSLPSTADFAPMAPVLIETLQTKAEADYLKFNAKYEADKLKPVLEVGYSYGRQGLDSSFSVARDDAFDPENDYQQVGVVFSVPLDLWLTSKSRQAAEAKAAAQYARSARAQRQSEIQWADLQRNVADQKERVKTAFALAKLQNDKSREERARLEKGKTTVFQAISFEQDAAESDLLALQLLSLLRRTEAQARAYIQAPDRK